MRSEKRQKIPVEPYLKTKSTVPSSLPRVLPALGTTSTPAKKKKKKVAGVILMKTYLLTVTAADQRRFGSVSMRGSEPSFPLLLGYELTAQGPCLSVRLEKVSSLV